MSDELNIEGNIDLDISKALKALDNLISNIAELRTQSPQLEKALGGIEKQATKVATSLNQGTSSITKQAKAVENLTSQYQKLGMVSLKGADRVAKELQSAFKLQGNMASQSQNSAFASYAPNIAFSKMLGEQEKAYSSYSKNILATARRTAAQEQQMAYQTYAQNMPAALRVSQRAAMDSYASNIAYTKQQEAMTRGLANQRYALYDVASSFAVVSAATLGAAGAATAVGISYEKAFAQVERTSQATGSTLENLRSELIALSMAVPISFEEIANIAALGGQLGIAASGLDEFTEVVAKLTATTNLSSEAAGTALGRFDALFKDIDPSNFEALGSAILKVGINSVATETQIVSVATQISSMGSFAGLTAEQVVGLSGALSSVGAQPELARGTVTRVFSQMSSAISAGGDSLDEFARLSGESADTFRSKWGTAQFAGVFQRFLQGIETEGQGAISTLNDLGISSVRDVPLLLRLAGAQDVVTQAFQDSASGFKEADELDRQYAITLKTVAAQLTIFGNTLKAALDTVGGSALGPLSAAIGLFQDLAEALVSFGGTDVGRIVGIVALSIVTLVGVMTGLRAVQALTTASTYAMITAQQGLTKAGFGSTGALGGLVKQMTLLTVGTTRATAANEAYKASIASGSGRVAAFGAGIKGATGAVNGLAAAGRTALSAFGWTAAIGVGITMLTSLANQNQITRTSIDEVTQSLDEQTGALTENTAAATAKRLEDAGYLAAGQAIGLSADVVTQAVLGQTDAINQVRDAIAATYAANDAAIGSQDGYSKAVLEATNAADTLSRGLDAQIGITEKGKEAWARLKEATGGAGGEMDNTGAAAEDLVGKLQDVINTHYDLIGGTVGVQDAIYNLGASLGEHGNDFSAYSVNGRANLQALEGTFKAMVTASGGDAAALATMVAGLMQTLAAQGVDTVNQLAWVQNALAQLTGGKGVGGLNGVGQAAQQAAGALGQGFTVGANKAAKAARNAGKGSKDASKEIKTLTDYVSDLGGVFKTAFDIRFGLGQSLDDVAEGWQKMADSAEDAREAVRDATQELMEADATIGSLKAANNTLEYQLTVAQKYGDVLRATEILAEIAENNAEISDEQKKRVKTEKELAKAQQSAIPSLEGQTEGSREQRDMVLGLVKSYQDQVLALANSGMSQQEVARRTQELKNQFVAQLTQMGYNRAEIDRYAAAFDDLTLAIQKVPRKITIDANMGPAERALAEFLAKASKASTSVSVGAVGGDGYGAGQAAGQSYAAGWTAAVNAGRRIVSALDNSVPGGRVYRSVDSKGNYGPVFFNKGGQVPKYLASGGGAGHPGGPKGSDTIPAWLTPGEAVTQAPAVKHYGMPFMNAINNMQIPKYLATGGPASGYSSSSSLGPRIQLVELLPNQLQQLAQMLSSELNIDGKMVAEATNSSNGVMARRGTN